MPKPRVWKIGGVATKPFTEVKEDRVEGTLLFTKASGSCIESTEDEEGIWEDDSTELSIDAKEEDGEEEEEVEEEVEEEDIVSQPVI